MRTARGFIFVLDFCIEFLCSAFVLGFFVGKYEFLTRPRLNLLQYNNIFYFFHLTSNKTKQA